MFSLFSVLNSFIPFAVPRALWHDVILSAILCGILYVAPHVNLQQLRSTVMGKWKNEPEAVGDAPVEEVVVEEEEEERRQDGHGIQVEVEVEVEEEGEAAHAPAEPPAEPANQTQHQPRPRDPNREVGAKKAKSIARRNQQRAYNEFLREQGDAQRAEWARDEARRQEVLEAEKERRAGIEAKVRERQRVEREERRKREERERREDAQKGRDAVGLVERRLNEGKVVDMRVVARKVGRDEEWVKGVVIREGILGRAGEAGRKETTMLTGQGWIVSVGRDAMDEAYKRAAVACEKGSGIVTWDQVSRLVQEIVVERQ